MNVLDPLVQQREGLREVPTVLLIEDDPASQMLVERALRHAGYRVLVARRALDGLELARRERPDLILTDLNLPDLNGRELAAMLRQEPALCNTPIVAISAESGPLGRTPAVAHGLSGFIPKPIDVEALPSIVESWLSEGDSEAGVVNPEDTYLYERLERLQQRARQLEEANDDLRRQAEAKDGLLRLNAGELRTPMSLILGYSQLMGANPRLRALFEEDLEARQLMEGMSSAVNRMQTVMNELMLLSRVLSNSLELTMGRVKLAEVVARSVSAYAEPMRQRKIALRFERVNFPNSIDADEYLLEIVFRNLLSNAIRFTPDGGGITLSARVIPGAAPGGVLRFSVRDSGIGIAPENLERIFGVYTTTPGLDLTSASKTNFLSPGVGLGLAVCKGIVSAHGGRLWAESQGLDIEHFPGSEFILVLPVKEKRDA